MATKILCAAGDCVYNNDKNVCTAKSINLSDYDVMTLWYARQRYQKCLTYQKSQHAIELEEKFKQFFEQRV